MNNLNDFSLILISILLEAIPFVLIGAFVSSIIQIYVSEATIAKIVPKSRILGLFGASLMGFIFPVCECAIVPIMRRLLKKGVPIHIAITFMLAVPIANPVVLLSTFYAFSGQWEYVFMRGILGILAAITVGHIVGRLSGDQSPLIEEVRETTAFVLPTLSVVEKKKKHPVVEVVAHTAGEFFDVGKFLIIGAGLSAAMQTFIPRESILSIGQGDIASILIMMTMAFVLSLCSEADAFIARTFLGQFTTGSIIGFLIFGPMIDIKNTLMLAGVVKKKFLIQLISVIAIICFAFAMVVNLLGI